jgi:glutathione S-transferase
MRAQLPMNLRIRGQAAALDADAWADVDRVLAIWRDCRTQFAAGGPFLFGSFSIADAMYAPVATRFRSYRVPLDAAATAYVETMAALPAMAEWAAAAQLGP